MYAIRSYYAAFAQVDQPERDEAENEYAGQEEVFDGGTRPLRLRQDLVGQRREFPLEEEYEGAEHRNNFV